MEYSAIRRIYYKDRVDIYRRKPEIEENIYNTLFLNILQNLVIYFIFDLFAKTKFIFDLFAKYYVSI